MNKSPEFAQLLTKEWLRRQKANRRYSLRAFAQSLEISPSRLSDLLNGKGGVSATRAFELIEKLRLPKDDFENLQLLIQKEMPGAQSLQKFAANEIKKNKKFLYARSIGSRGTVDRLRWEHLYITELVSDESLSEKVLAKRLSLHPADLAHLLRECEELDLIEVDEEASNTWRAIEESRRFGDEKPSVSLRKLHFQMLRQIPEFCEDSENEERELSSSLLQLNLAQTGKLRMMVREFAKECLAVAQPAAGGVKRLYGLTIQLFPIENNKKNKVTNKKETL